MEEFVGNIQLNGGIVPKNGQNFPLVRAQDVLLPNGKRLSNYSGAEHSFDISNGEGGKVTIHLFQIADGYEAFVTAEQGGVMANYNAPTTESDEKVDGYLTGISTVKHNDNRPYAKYVDKIVALHIDDSITEIGDYFMANAYRLKHLYLSEDNNITRLGKGAFQYTQIQGEIAFPKLNQDTIDCVFSSCHKIDGITLGGSVKSITGRSFAFCLNLRYVRGLSSVTTIGEGAFWTCTCLESIDIVPSQVDLGVKPDGTTDGYGGGVFLLTPTDAKVKANDEDPGTLLWQCQWKAKGKLPTAQEYWGKTKIQEIQKVKCNSISLPIPKMDNQGTDLYDQWGIIPMIYKFGQNLVWFPSGMKASGQCGVFSRYHIYNIMNPTAQYDTFHAFLREEIFPRKIKVTESLHKALQESEYGPALMNPEKTYSDGSVHYDSKYNASYFSVGNMISPNDLPMALDSTTDTWGDEGTWPWAVAKVLGWKTKEILFGATIGGTYKLGAYDNDGNFVENTNRGAEVKRILLDELQAGRPVAMDIVGPGQSGSNYGHNMHSVVAIGYDNETDKLLIIDSTNYFPADIDPLVYWLPFESLITDHSSSCIWAFDFGKDTTIVDVDKKVDRIEGMIASINSGFRMVKSINGTDWTYSEGKITLNCPYDGVKLVLFKGTDATIDVIMQRAKDSVYDSANQQYPYYMYGAMLQPFDFDTKSWAKAQNQNSAFFVFAKIKGLESYGPAGTVGALTFTETIDGKIQFSTMNFTEYLDDAKTIPAEYTWTAYYWDE